jgi:hypothetical protein
VKLRRGKEITESQVRNLPVDQFNQLRDAKAAELKKFASTDSYDVISKAQAYDLIKAGRAVKLIGRWVYTLSHGDKIGDTKYKARWCVRGDLDDRDLEVQCPTPSWPSSRLFLYV